MSEPVVSKSKYLSGLQCPKLLWYYYNAKDQIPAFDEATQAIFDQGHEVGELAKKLYPDGIDVTWDQPYAGVIKQTQELLKSGKPLFEAGLRNGSMYARADVLEPVGKRWDLIEVKMSTEVKDVNLQDVAFQRCCYEGASLPIRRCYLMHINSEYVRKGDIDPCKLFTKEDVTDQVKELIGDVPGLVEEMVKTIAKKQCPNQDIGPHCSDPYQCPLMDVCWGKVWKHDNHVFTLPGARGRDWKLYEAGILTTDKIPAGFALSSKQKIMIKAERTGRPYIDRAALREFLDGLIYPLFYLDFETFGLNVPIPVVQKSHPYQQIPFQYSLYVQASPKASPVHHSWIWDGQGDPREEMMRRLPKLLERKGSVVVYNQTFEASRLRECAEFLPEYEARVASVIDRMVDLYAPFRSFTVYHPDQHGSASLKSVLPALTGKGYDSLEIQGGGQACSEFMRVTFCEATAAERASVHRNLEAYCGLDTFGMVDIVRALGRL